MEEAITLSQAEKEVEEANEEYIKAMEVTRRYRNGETSALNRLNKAQKNLDNLIESMRKAAPPASDWNKSR